MAATISSRLKAFSALRLLAFAVVIALAFCLVGCDDDESSSSPSGGSPSGGATPTTAKGESIRVSRVINVVYDDSSSMNYQSVSGKIIDDDTWSRAHYAIEVFAAMLDENDTLKVYTMSDADNKKTEPALVISGKDSMNDRVKKAHEVFSEMDSWTNFGAAKSAHDDLAKQPDNVEKWLVVLTDGMFTDYDSNLNHTSTDPDVDAKIVQSIQKDFEKWGKEGIHVEYVGMREDATHFNSGTNLNAQVVSPDKILQTIIEESNKVFGRAELPKSSFNGKQLEMSVPMKKVIVFAQGEGVSVGDLGVSSKKSQSANVRYADQSNKKANPGGGYISKQPDTQLQGVVKIFEGQFKAGTVDLAVSKAQTVDIYYEPYVDIHMAMKPTNGGNEIVLSEGVKGELPPGSYTASFSLYDPFTKEPISSDLVTAECTTTLEYAGGSKQEIKEGQVIQIEEGQAQLGVEAIINGDTRYTQSYDVDIISRSMGIEILSKPAEPVDVYQLDNADPIVVRVNRQDGTPLSAEEMAVTKLELSTPVASEPVGLLGLLLGKPYDLDYTVEATSEPGVFNIHLKTHKGDPAKTADGDDVPIHITASREAGFGGYVSLGETDTTLDITPVPWIIRWWLPLLLLLILLLLVAFIVMQIRKPRIPKGFSPRIVGIDGDEEMDLAFSRTSIRHSIWPPWAPETATFDIELVDDPTNYYQLEKRFELAFSTLEIVAAGQREVQLSEDDIAMMQAQLDAYDDDAHGAGQFPYPGYDGFTTPHGPDGTGFTIVGLKPVRRRGRTVMEEAEYDIIY